MIQLEYRGRKAHAIENESLQVVVSDEGGHIAAITDKASGTNPLWSPPWPSIEPSSYDPAQHPGYGGNAESKLLAGILGHNLCLDIFGGPSDEEAAAGLTVHGEASIAKYEFAGQGASMTQRATFPIAQLRFARTLSLAGRTVTIREEIENLGASDRPIGWTQHVTLGPPFLERGKTQFRASATRSKVIESDFSGGKGYMKSGVVFDWPAVPSLDGKTVDMRTYIDLPVSAAYSAHLMDPHQDFAYFTAWSPSHKLLLTYRWKRADFPWLGIWEENCSRTTPPWNGKTITRGMEFGVSPFPETRRAMIDRNSLFGVPGYRWIPARSKVAVEYTAALTPADSAQPA